jgi:NADPH-dependent ferric siderophore reductase
MNGDGGDATVGGGLPGPGQSGGRGPRRPPQLVEVVSVAYMTPRLVSVQVTGGDLARFAEAAPTSHLKVFLPAPGQDAPTLPVMTPEGRSWPEGATRPTIRTYTPRYFDQSSGTLEVQFVLHGEGPASEWAQRARVGDKLAVGGPGGRFSADLAAAHWWIAGDESALPAVGTLLEALPASATADVHLEVAGPADEIALESEAHITIAWHHRREPQAWGVELHDAARRGIRPDAQVWVACEALAVREIRKTMLGRQVVPASALVTRGYWRRGVVDHPDHDYGED